MINFSKIVCGSGESRPGSKVSRNRSEKVYGFNYYTKMHQNVDESYRKIQIISIHIVYS